MEVYLPSAPSSCAPSPLILLLQSQVSMAQNQDSVAQSQENMTQSQESGAQSWECVAQSQESMAQRMWPSARIKIMFCRGRAWCGLKLVAFKGLEAVLEPSPFDVTRLCHHYV